MIHIRFGLGYCDECNQYIIPGEELDDVKNDLIIHFSPYTYQGRCATHGIITNGTRVCRLCEENDYKKWSNKEANICKEEKPY